MAGQLELLLPDDQSVAAAAVVERMGRGWLLSVPDVPSHRLRGSVRLLIADAGDLPLICNARIVALIQRRGAGGAKGVEHVHVELPSGFDDVDAALGRLAGRPIRRERKPTPVERESGGGAAPPSDKVRRREEEIRRSRERLERERREQQRLAEQESEAEEARRQEDILLSRERRSRERAESERPDAGAPPPRPSDHGARDDRAASTRRELRAAAERRTTGSRSRPSSATLQAPAQEEGAESQPATDGTAGLDTGAALAMLRRELDRLMRLPVTGRLDTVPGAPAIERRRAFVQAARDFHPDRFRHHGDAEVMELAQEIYLLLAEAEAALAIVPTASSSPPRRGMRRFSRGR